MSQTTVQEIIDHIRNNRRPGMQVSKKITCNDGLVISAQASEYHYCEPRDNDGPWTEVECGYPSRRIEELMEYAEDKDRPTDTVYAHVPIETIAAVVSAAGGIKN